MPRLIEKVFISGKIVAETGLHIGGSKTALDIGGVDLNVIKTAKGVPFIPGSSLKGKLRTILAREYGSTDVREDPEIIKEIFGAPNDKPEQGTVAKKDNGIPARLIVRDAFLLENHFEETFTDLELVYSEIKWENTINRKTGTAEHPRQLERVPAGAQFSFSFIYNVFDDGKKEKHLKEIIKAMKILEDDYLGGQGSRGYGQIKFLNNDVDKVAIEVKTIADYMGDNQRKPVPSETPKF
jgi:CRISPR-associated protein Csm3